MFCSAAKHDRAALPAFACDRPSRSASASPSAPSAVGNMSDADDAGDVPIEVTTIIPGNGGLLPASNLCANLPILFAQGYPVNLQRITAGQLETFIPFMVRCSLGFLTLGPFDYTEPEWWPEDVPFVIPLQRTANVTPDAWRSKLAHIVRICYAFHKVSYILKFADELMQYERRNLRFIDHQNHTTSMYHRRTNKLLVTFRNENMKYDEAPKSKKTLLPRGHLQAIDQRSSSQQRNGTGADVESTSAGSSGENLVELLSPFDIYLCDYCDSELYSLEAFIEHEQDCTRDDDVIFCGTTPATTPAIAASSVGAPPAGNATADHTPKADRRQLQTEFLHLFGLHNGDHPLPRHPPADADPPTAATTTTAVKKTAARRTMRTAAIRPGMGLAKSPAIPISSPAGQALVRALKPHASDQVYFAGRLERLESLCAAPPLPPNAAAGPPRNHPLFAFMQPNTGTAGPNVPRTFRRPADYDEAFAARPYRFPLRQLAQARFGAAHAALLRHDVRLCQPCAVPVRMLTALDIRRTCIEERWRRQLRAKFPNATNFKVNRLIDARRRQVAARRLQQRQTATTVAQTAPALNGRAMALRSPIGSGVYIGDPVVVDLCSSDEDADGPPVQPPETATPPEPDDVPYEQIAAANPLLDRLMRTSDLTLSLSRPAKRQWTQLVPTELVTVTTCPPDGNAGQPPHGSAADDDDIQFVDAYAQNEQPAVAPERPDSQCASLPLAPANGIENRQRNETAGSSGRKRSRSTQNDQPQQPKKQATRADVVAAPAGNGSQNGMPPEARPPIAIQFPLSSETISMYKRQRLRAKLAAKRLRQQQQRDASTVALRERPAQPLPPAIQMPRFVIRPKFVMHGRPEIVVHQVHSTGAARTLPMASNGLASGSLAERLPCKQTVSIDLT